MVAALLSMSLQTTAFANVITNDQLAVESSMQIQRSEVATFLAREDVRSSLSNAGVSASNLDKRINNLSDSQVLQIHSQMNSLPAGGNGILGAILVIILIFILLDLAGATDVFPGV
jgi:hypothetical protein